MRTDVKMMKASGWSHEKIAACLEISRSSLEKHFVEELATGAAQEQRMALRALRRQVNRGNVSAIKEMLKRYEAGSAIDEFLAQPEKPAPAEKPKRLGKKEQQLEEARTAHVDTEWADDLPPLPERLH